jgi:hypothetical protein
MRININSTTYNLSLNIKLNKCSLKWQFKDDSWDYSGKIVFINVVKNKLFFGNENLYLSVKKHFSSMSMLQNESENKYFYFVYLLFSS